MADQDPFAEIRPIFQNAAICLNLETSLRSDWQKRNKIVLSIDKSALKWLSSDIQLITIVNNHAADSGDPRSLAEALTETGKMVVGPSNPSVGSAAIGGRDVDFFACYFALPRLRLSYNGKQADALIRLLRASRASRKIVNLHWGYEYTDIPAPFQRQLSHRLIDEGADLIIGHHPHVPQGFETYHGVRVYYSLGNFNFYRDERIPHDTDEWGYMVLYDVESNSSHAIPYLINNNYQPYAINDQHRRDYEMRLGQLSDSAISTDVRTWFLAQYKNWYLQEFRAWWEEWCEHKGSKILLSFLIWLLLPMQCRFYWLSLKRGWRIW